MKTFSSVNILQKKQTKKIIHVFGYTVFWMFLIVELRKIQNLTKP